MIILTLTLISYHMYQWYVYPWFSRSPCTPFRLLRAIRHLFWPPHISSLTKSANHRQISYRRPTYIALHLKVVLHWIANGICMFSQQGQPIEDYQYLLYCSVSLRDKVCMWTCVYVKVAEDLKHLCFFLYKLISRQREASESASFNLIPITHNIKGFNVQICRRGSSGGEI